MLTLKLPITIFKVIFVKRVGPDQTAPLGAV